MNRKTAQTSTLDIQGTRVAVVRGVPDGRGPAVGRNRRQPTAHDGPGL